MGRSAKRHDISNADQLTALTVSSSSEFTTNKNNNNDCADSNGNGSLSNDVDKTTSTAAATTTPSGKSKSVKAIRTSAGGQNNRKSQTALTTAANATVPSSFIPFTSCNNNGDAHSATIGTNQQQQQQQQQKQQQIDYKYVVEKIKCKLNKKSKQLMSPPSVALGQQPLADQSALPAPPQAILAPMTTPKQRGRRAGTRVQSPAVNSTTATTTTTTPAAHAPPAPPPATSTTTTTPLKRMLFNCCQRNYIQI